MNVKIKFDGRPYQVKGESDIKSCFRDGFKRPLLWAATGSGKGWWTAKFVANAVNNNRKVLIVIKRRTLIYQTIKMLKKYGDIEASAIIGTYKTAFDSKVLVCSIDTLTRRISKEKYQFLKDFDLTIVDECHDAVSPSYEKLFWWLEGYELKDYDKKLFKQSIQNFKKYYIGCTATPHKIGNRVHHFWDCLVKPIEPKELMEQGYLSPARVFAPKKIDTTGLRTSKGDFDQKALFERVSKLEVIGDTVSVYKEYANGKSAIVFCVNVDHSKMVAEAFRREGIPAIHCDANHSQEERDDATKKLKSGEYKVLTNCNIFSTGWDYPAIEVGIFARPTESENLAIQQWGRVLRPYKLCANCNTEYGADPTCYNCGSSDLAYEKEYATIIDQGNNTARFGLPYDERKAHLHADDVAAGKNIIKKDFQECPKCFLKNELSEKYCEFCHTDLKKQRDYSDREINQVDGELVEVDPEFLKNQEYRTINQKYNLLKRVEISNNLHYMWKFYKLYEEFEDKVFNHCDQLGISEKMIHNIKREIDKRKQDKIKLSEQCKKQSSRKVYQ